MDREAVVALAEILDCSTERLTSFELPRRKAVLLLRWTFFASLLGLRLMNPHGPLDTLVIDLVLGLAVIANLGVSFLPAAAFRTASLEFSLGILDTALVSFVFFKADPSGYLCLFFFILLATTAIATRISQVLFGALALSAMFLLSDGDPTIARFTVIPLFYTAALSFGYQVLQIRDRHARADRIYRERQELKVILNILDSITSSLDFHEVMFRITSRIADVVEAVRCSIVLIEEASEDRAFVVATSDDRKLKMLPLDLIRYPEVQLAIRRKKPIMIEDVEKNAMLRPYLEDLRRLKFQSILVLPILSCEAIVGTLILRATRKRAFTPDEQRFCRVIASAAANAIKNSMLYRRLEERAQKQEEMAARIRSLFDNSPDLILRIDADGRIREANRTVEQVSGRTQAEILSLNLTSLIRDLPPVSVLTEGAQRTKMPLVCEAKLLAAGDPERDLSVTVGTLEESNGGLILIARDVTEQKQAFARLQQTERLSSIGEIVASVAHELNNPLSGVLGYSQLLDQKDTQGIFKRESQRIIQSAERCQKIVQNLLSFARPASSEKKSLGLNGVLEKTLDLQEHTLQENNIAVERDLAPDLPYVFGDFHQIQQVLTNLIVNAQQAMSADKKPGRLLLRTYSREGRVVLEVTDDGPGIPPEVLSRIFDPFFSTKKLGRGTGLGLSISYGIVRDHGGELGVETHLRKGTTFSVVFPVDATAHSHVVPDKSPVLTAGTGRQILVVDDEEVIVDLYMELLQALGHTVDTAANGLEALKKIEARDYDLVVSDIRMPKLNGVQLYQRVAEIKPEMSHRFIFITGDLNALTSNQVATITDSPYLLKPASLEEIETTIRELLGEKASPTDVPISQN